MIWAVLCDGSRLRDTTARRWCPHDQVKVKVEAKTAMQFSSTHPWLILLYEAVEQHFDSTHQNCT